MLRRLFPILFVTLIDVIGFTILIPLLPFYAQRFGASPVQIGLIYTTVAFCALIAAPIWGRVSDRVGRKPVLIVAQVAATIGYLTLGIGNSLPAIFVGRAIEGLGGGGIGVLQAYVSDLTTPEERSKAFALVGATFGTGFLIGPLLGGTLVQFGYAVPMLAAAFFGVLTVAITIFGLPNSHEPSGKRATLRELAHLLVEPELGRLLLTQFAFSIAFTFWVSTFALYAQHRLGYSPVQASHAYAVVALCAVLTQTLLVGRLVERLGEARVTILGLGCVLGAFVAVGFVRDTPAFVATAALWSLGGALVRPTLGATISRLAPAGDRGAILSFNDTMGNVAFMLAPPLATYVLGHDLNLVGIAPAIAAACGLGLALATRRHIVLAERRAA